MPKTKKALVANRDVSFIHKLTEIKYEMMDKMCEHLNGVKIEQEEEIPLILDKITQQITNKLYGEEKQSVSLAIDPGAKGAVVLLDNKTLECLEVYDTETMNSYTTRVNILTMFFTSYNITHIFIEDPPFSITVPKKGKNGKTTYFSNANAVGKLARDQGIWLGICHALNTSEEFPAQIYSFASRTWGTRLKGKGALKKRSENFTTKSNLYKNKILGPKKGFKDGRSDAICIGLYGIETYVNK